MSVADENKLSKFDLLESQLEWAERSHPPTRSHWLSNHSAPPVIRPNYKKGQSVSSNQNIALEHHGFEIVVKIIQPHH